MPELARTTRTCAYDRAGTGFSLPAGSSRTAQDDVDDLHGLLDRADIKGPYVLVGHSFGGILAQLYASQHPDEVAGVVLVDSSSFDQKRRYLKAIGPARPGEARIVTELRSFLTHPGRSPEGIDFNEVLSKGGSVRSIDPKPLIVISAGQETSAQAPARWRRTFDRVWLSLQSDLARLSSNSRHVIAVYSPHFVMSPLGQPELVVRGVREVVQAVRAGRRLRPCPAVFAPPAARCVG
jgi:pimeloyl-ACP methyl ester carboxylesterase